ncbi:cathepsin L [Caerostris extrusa]|uniref:Cathepsin L n=1 Tax=Caerostris extrusa TaxID=172846 RepID=A0AAV4NFK8_CAEEX|nr:cathepsin L [Caerostris extrusa]
MPTPVTWPVALNYAVEDPWREQPDRGGPTDSRLGLNPVSLLAREYADNGCNGGLMTAAFDYIKSVTGEDSEVSYPYQGKQGQCNFREGNVVASVTGYVEIPSGDEAALLEAVATVGPIAVAIDSSSDSFTTYNGIYDEPSCSSTLLDHAVVLIGYGTEDDGLDYWLVKTGTA